MKKDLGVQQAVFPMPVLMVAAYDENEKVNVMNVAWGQICGSDKIYLCIGKGKKTLSNILKSKAFTVSLADAAHMEVADFYGITSGNSMEDKFERTGFTAIKSDKVNAPIIDEFPVAIECEFLEELDTGNIHGVVGRIVNVKADESVLAEDGKVDVMKLNVLMFDNFRLGYYTLGEKAGQAFDVGKKLI
jgi:flavin reductase (DIM6/NTAB) family NADH-FMN oxidoreductase RutF